MHFLQSTWVFGPFLATTFLVTGTVNPPDPRPLSGFLGRPASSRYKIRNGFRDARPYLRVMKNSGFSLLETLIAMFLTMVAALAVAPMFVQAARTNDAGADMGSVGAIAVDRLEQLRQEPWRDLLSGGSLTENVDGYFSAAGTDFLVRWRILDDPTTTQSKAITVIALAREAQIGPRRQVELTVARAR